jgi:hypothetical protein
MSKLAAALVLVAVTAPAAAGALEATKPSQVVAVYARAATAPACAGAPVGVHAFESIGKSDGTTVPFAIPAKSVFVVQGFDFSTVTVANRFTSFTVLAVDPAHPVSLGVSGAIAAGGAVADENGFLGGTVTIPGGLVIKPPAVPCFSSGLADDDDSTVILHGFFAKDK